MEEQTKRIAYNIIESIDSFLQNAPDEKGLLLDLESLAGAIDNKELKKCIEGFIIKVEESLYLYDVREGKEFLINEIDIVKRYLSDNFIKV